jgi:hypothetical protein
MGEGAGIERQAQRRWRRRADVRDVVVAVPPAPRLVDRLSVDEAVHALDISAAPVRSRIRPGELKAERVARRGGTAWAVWPLVVEDEAPHRQVVSPGGPPHAAPFVERVVHTAPAMAGGLAVWCSLAALAQQLAAANASQARARHRLEREHARLEREHARLVAEVEDAAEMLAIQAAEHARAARRAGRLIYSLSLMVVALGALLLMVGPLAAIGRLGT